MNTLRTFGDQIQNAFTTYGVKDTRVEFEYLRDDGLVSTKNPRGLGTIVGAKAMIVRRKDDTKPWTRDNVRVILRATKYSNGPKPLLRVELWRQLWNDYKSRNGFLQDDRRQVRLSRDLARAKAQVPPAEVVEQHVQVRRS